MGSLNGGVPISHKHQAIRNQGNAVVVSTTRDDDVVAEKFNLSHTDKLKQLENSIKGMASRLVWLDADDSSTLTTSNGLVTRWNDKTSNGIYADDSYIGTSEPALTSIDCNGVSRGALLFNGLNQATTALNIGTQLDSMVGAGKSFSIYIAFRIRTIKEPFGTMTLISKCSYDNIAYWFYVYSDTVTTPEIEGYLGSNGSWSNYAYHVQLSQDLDIDTNYIFGAQYNATISPSTNRLGMRTDGVDGDITRTSSGAGLVNITDNNEPLAIGVAYDASSPFDGHIMEVLIFNNTLSSTDRDNIENYLSLKWGATTPALRLGAD